MLDDVAMNPKRRVVVTGGPGAGKTAVLEMARRELGARVEVLPEAASILFGGGFPRRRDDASQRSAQRAIYHVQNELERLPHPESVEALLCDRGTIDGLAYWPGARGEFLDDLSTSLEREMARYDAVVHLRVPTISNGYQRSSLRIESEVEATIIDGRLLEIWSHHPRHIVIETSASFVTKAEAALDAIRSLLDRVDHRTG